jgi:radical SAM/Cys-rich protein
MESAATLPILDNTGADMGFHFHLRAAGIPELRARRITTLQVNVGKVCNQACHHCHVDAGPTRTEHMSAETVQEVLGLLERFRFDTLDITGGAPELHPQFRTLARRGRELCARVIDRCNLTILLEPGFEDLGRFLADHAIEIAASLPCYLAENVERQRGRGVFDRSICALQRLNGLGYGREGSSLILNLVYNPVGPSLPPPQDQLEQHYKAHLGERYGIVFNRLFNITNMPINRFRHDLQRSGRLGEYMQRLEKAFNPATVEHLMCREIISVGWQGTLHDCDFNQMLDLPLEQGLPRHIRDFDPHSLCVRRIRTGDHCLGCTAGSGSSCTGAVVPA